MREEGRVLRRAVERVTLRRALLGLGLLAGTCVLLFAVLAAIAQRQRVVLPEPSGPDEVGRRQLDWIDTSRVDPLSDQPGQARRLPVWVWYPAAVPPGSQAS